MSQEDVDINYYEDIRKKFVQETVSKGIPKDIEVAALLLRAIDGGVKTALVKKKIMADKEANENTANVQLLMSKILMATPTVQQNLKRIESLPDVDLVSPLPGETEIGTKEVRYNKIMKED